jgi:23S rRNA (cytidine2498-2'-O)-methyltransferase
VPNSLLVVCCEIGWEQAVTDELRHVFPGRNPRVIADGWMLIEEFANAAPATPTVALASQCLPEADQIENASIAEWVHQAGQRIIDRLGDHTGPWRLHVFGIYAPEGLIPRRRLDLIEAGVIDLLRKKQRRLLRALLPGEGQFRADEALAQIALVTPKSGYSSVCLPDTLLHWRRCVSPFPAGRVEVPPDRRAPSRAFAKLVEAEIRLGCCIAGGNTVVDLGASPGSWSYVALGRGANVSAVDRSPLRADLLNHPNLTFVRGDAFEFVPHAPIDWLLCDVIAFPDRLLALLERWLSEQWCRRFCVTVKFRGSGEYAILERFKLMLERQGCEFLLRRLTSNKNEVTAFGTLARVN